MEYTIGCTIIEKKDNSKTQGLLACGNFGFQFLLTKKEVQDCIDKRILKDKGYLIYTFDNVEDAVYYSRVLTKAYRRDDCSNNFRIKSKKIRMFYPLKIDSSKFEYELENSSITNSFKWGVFGEPLVTSKKLYFKTIVDLKK